MRAPRHRDGLPRELCRRGGARHAGGRERQALRRARHRLADSHDLQRGRVRHHRGRGDADGLQARAGDRLGLAARDAQARHSHPAGRRLRLRMDAARHQCQRPSVLRRLHRHDAQGGADGGNAPGRRDHVAARRTGAIEGGLSCRHRPHRRRSAARPVVADGPGKGATGHEGWRDPQGLRDARAIACRAASGGR
ncbi:hypothetical protein D9M68_769390 [compost metagenome]